MNDVDTYINKLEQPQKEEMSRIRAMVRKTVPEAAEAISYGMPAFKYKGKYLIGYAAFKNHMSLFPTSVPIEELKDQLEGHVTSKGTIQFTPENALSDEVIRALVLAGVRRIDN